MLTFFHPQELSTYIHSLKKEGKTIGFFPTMGALHEGHLSLLEACKKACDISVCSIFVNPTQFTNPEDLEKYPRKEASDRILLEQAGCDILFLPEQNEIYAREKPLKLNMGELTRRFEGASRPGHFEGVARIVRILFDCVEPHTAFFGLKDYQQCMVIRKLVDELDMGIELRFMPTLREPDGLAMSSRNLRLNAEQRKAAPLIHQVLLKAEKLFSFQNYPELEKQCIADIEKESGLRVDYFTFANAETLEPLKTNMKGKPVVILTAVFAGDIRLIDNLLLK